MRYRASLRSESGLGFRDGLIQVSQRLRSDVLLLVNLPDLVLPLVSDASIFGFFNFDTEFFEFSERNSMLASLRHTYCESFVRCSFRRCALATRAASCGSSDSNSTSIKAAVRHAFDVRSPQKGAEDSGALRVCAEVRQGEGSDAPPNSGYRPRLRDLIVCNARVSLCRILTCVSM